jgi:hypothetical protein
MERELHDIALDADINLTMAFYKGVVFSLSQSFCEGNMNPAIAGRFGEFIKKHPESRSVLEIVDPDEKNPLPNDQIEEEKKFIKKSIKQGLTKPEAEYKIGRMFQTGLWEKLGGKPFIPRR